VEDSPFYLPCGNKRCGDNSNTLTQVVVVRVVRVVRRASSRVESGQRRVASGQKTITQSSRIGQKSIIQDGEWTGERLE